LVVAATLPYAWVDTGMLPFRSREAIVRQIVLIVVAVFVVAALWQLAASRAASDPGVTVYDPNPSHPWNRLYTALMVREDRSGHIFGIDSLDPLLWSSSDHLLEPKSHRETIRILDEFLHAHAENRIHDPLRRALLIRDLWAVFDWSVARTPDHLGGPEYTPEKQELQIRLAEDMRRLALTSQEIASLPDNYAQAVVSGTFAKQYDRAHPERSFLPPDLFDQHGPWIQLGNWEGPVAPQHTFGVSGRSRFLIYLRFPGGRKAGFDYLRQLWEYPQPWVVDSDAPLQAEINPLLPSFPPETEVALVRQMTMFDNLGNLIPAPITESVQIRVYRSILPASSDRAADLNSANSGSRQDFFEIHLDRAQLLNGKSGGLREVARDERDFLLFSAMPIDEIDDPLLSKNWSRVPPILQECAMCHRGAGINSLNSRAALLKPNLLQHDADYELPARWWENDGTILWKQNRYDWGLLNGYWKASKLP
jgi:hypothetical protein